MQAVNGIEALKIAQWFKPDIVISDIRMPKMDGIEFAEKLTGINPDSRLIFISGYMEIDYLKKAIQLAAVDYIEKPVELQALDKAIAKAVEDIHRIRLGKAAVEEQKELQQQKLFRLLIDKDADKSTLEKLFQENGILMKGGCFQCVVAMHRKENGNIEKNMEEIERILAAAGFRALSGYNAEKRQYEFVISYQEKDLYRLNPMYQRLLEKIPDLCIGIGIEAQNYRNVYNSYRTANMAMNCAFYQADERFFVIDGKITQKAFINPNIYGEFLRVMSEPVSRIEAWCADLFQKLSFYKYYRKEQVYTLLISFLNALYQKHPYLCNMHSEIPSEDGISAYVLNLGTLSEIRELFFQIFEYMKIHKQEQSGYSRIVCGVQDYIEKHYREESLSITEIAEQLHLSPAYLNVLFKQEMKMTLKQYLNNYRLEKAKKMLEQGYDKITEIAEKCGYANSNYFAKVFKEATDMTPVEYRRATGGENE